MALRCDLITVGFEVSGLALCEQSRWYPGDLRCAAEARRDLADDKSIPNEVLSEHGNVTAQKQPENTRTADQPLLKITASDHLSAGQEYETVQYH